MRVAWSSILAFAFLLSLVSCTQTGECKTEKPDTCDEESDLNLLESIDKELQTTPNAPELHYGKAVVLYELQRYEEAISAADDGIKRRNDVPYLFAIRGKSYLALGKLNEAKADYQKAQQLWPAHDVYAGMLDLIREKQDALKTKAPQQR